MPGTGNAEVKDATTPSPEMLRRRCPAWTVQSVHVEAGVHPLDNFGLSGPGVRALSLPLTHLDAPNCFFAAFPSSCPAPLAGGRGLGTAPSLPEGQGTLLCHSWTALPLQRCPWDGGLRQARSGFESLLCHVNSG